MQGRLLLGMVTTRNKHKKILTEYFEWRLESGIVYIF